MSTVTLKYGPSYDQNLKIRVDHNFYVMLWLNDQNMIPHPLQIDYFNIKSIIKLSNYKKKEHVFSLKICDPVKPNNFNPISFSSFFSWGF